MKKNIFITIIVVLGIVVFNGCVDDEDIYPTYNMAKDMWGEWIRMDADETWYITQNSISIDGVRTTKVLTLVGQSERIIQVTDNGRVYYLYASRIANASISGRIAAFDQDARSISGQRSVAGGKGWANVVSEHLNSGTTTTSTADGNGGFIFNEIIPGDEYRITPEGGTPVIVRPAADNDDIGTITIVEGNNINFKASVASGADRRSLDTGMLTVNGFHQSAVQNLSYSKLYVYDSLHSYNIQILIQNTGNIDAVAAIYELSFDDGLVVTSGNTSGILGTLEPGRTGTISVSLRCAAASIFGDFAFKRIFITITDPINNRTWNDSVSLRFFKEAMLLATNEGLNPRARGIVILPTGNAIRFSHITITGRYQNTGAIVPRFANRDYLVVFSGATADTETAYELQISGGFTPNILNFRPFQDFALGTDLARYEPNDTEATATFITGSIRAFLHKNDIDFYRFRF